MRNASLSFLLSPILLASLSGCPHRGVSDPCVVRGDCIDGTVRLPPPEPSIFIRASFDSDPSDLLGRFFPEDVGPAELDENKARVSSRCRAFLETREFEASDTFEQTFNASDSAKASVGVKPFGTLEARLESSAGLLVKYAMTKKMVVRVADEDGFARCCAAARTECGSRMIGEFWFGTGTVSQFAGREKDFGAKASYKLVAGELSYKDGWAWRRVRTFENTYFAFRTVAGPAEDQACAPGWEREPPRSLDGQFFVGVAQVLAPEAKAREEALRNARREVVKYLGEALAEVHTSASSSLGGALRDETLVTAAASGVARRVKDRCWSDVAVAQTPEGPYTTIRVLAFVSTADLEAAKPEALAAMEAAAATLGKEALSRELRGVREVLPR